MSACRAGGGNTAVSPKSKRPRLRAYLCFCAALFIELATVLCTYLVLRHNHRLALKTGMSRLVDRLENSMSDSLNGFEYTVRRNAAITRLHGTYMSSTNFTDILQLQHHPGLDSAEACK
jgi:hypothetical protein